MANGASRVFDFLEHHNEFAIERHVHTLFPFLTLRKSVMQMAQECRQAETQDANDLSFGLWTILLEWLTSPVKFDQSTGDALRSLLGESEAFQVRWGRNMSILYAASMQALSELPMENPMRTTLRDVIRGLQRSKSHFRIYCHRRAQEHFTSLMDVFDEQLLDNAFIHSVSEYREAEPFEVLIKAGPLKASGWSAIPDAIITAPRFVRLVQVVWENCSDQPDFGYDPVASFPGIVHRAESGNKGDETGMQAPLEWISAENTYGTGPRANSVESPGPDELAAFYEIQKERDHRRAVLVILETELAIFFPPYSLVLSFDSDASSEQPIDNRLPGETLFSGMYILHPLIEDIDFGTSAVARGAHASIWKARLREELRTDADRFCKLVRANGIDLQYLLKALEYWALEPTEVIHGPKTKEHFRALISTLGIIGESDTDSRHWGELAWLEIKHSRGEAISSGHQKQEIIEEQLQIILVDSLPEIRERCKLNKPFVMGIPSGYGLSGTVLVWKVVAIEDGFEVPTDELRKFHQLRMVDQWRK